MKKPGFAFRLFVFTFVHFTISILLYEATSRALVGIAARAFACLNALAFLPLNLFPARFMSVIFAFLNSTLWGFAISAVIALVALRRSANERSAGGEASAPGPQR